MNSILTNSSGWRSEDFAIDESAAPDLDMSIRIDADGLYFFASSREKPAHHHSAYVPFSSPDVEGLKSAFFSHPWLSHPYASTHLYIDDQSVYLLIPNDLVDAAEPCEWLSSLTDTHSREILSSPLPDEGSALVFGVSSRVYEFCARSFSYPRYRHRIQPFISLGTTLSRLRYPRLMLSHLWGESLDLLYIENGRLRMANSYVVRTPIDQLYYLTATWRLFDLSPGADPLYLYADAPPLLEGLLPHLRGYIKDIHVQEFPPEVTPEVHPPSHSPFPPSLLIDHLCE